MNNISKAALAYFDAGLTPISIALDGSKRPIGLWGEWIESPPSRAQVELMFKKPCGIALLCGPTSGGLECIDFDQPGYFADFSDLVKQIAPDLLDKLVQIQTPRGDGFHLYYRTDVTQGNQKLAFLVIDGKKQTAVETRGKGGYAIVPKSPPEAHPSKRPYVHIGGPQLEQVQRITAEEREILLDCARSMNLVAEDAPGDSKQTAAAPLLEGEELRPGDDFNRRAEWRPLLERHGWRVIRERGDVTHWQRPGKDGKGISATTGHCGDKLYVFSSNAAPFESGRTCSKFWAYALLEHGGDFAKAAKQARKDGYGTPRKKANSAIKSIADSFKKVFGAEPPQQDEAPLPGDEYAPPQAEEDTRITAAQLEEKMHDDPTWPFHPGMFERVLAMKSDRAEWVAICDVLKKLKKKDAWNKAVKEHERQQKREKSGGAAWQKDMLYRESKDGDLKLDSCLTNCIAILQNDDQWLGKIGLDEFEGQITIKNGAPFSRAEEKLFEDDDILETKSWLERTYAIRPGTQDVHDAMAVVAKRQAFNPLRDYLNGLDSDARESGDDTPTIDTWLIDLLGAPDTPYVRAVSAKWMIAAVARAYEPGCKVDTVLILEGEQGMKKSRMFEQLCPNLRWFIDGLSEFGTKAQAEEIQGKWIVELAELKGFGRDIEQVKAFVTRRQETYRPAYGRTTVVRGRTCIFGGTVNLGANGYLRDETGNRRFWPVRCTRAASEMTPELRDRLWAEARDRYRDGEKWWLEEQALIVSAAEEAAERLQIDPWQENIERHLIGEMETSVNDVLDKLKIETAKRGSAESQRVGRILQAVGWKRFRANRSGIRVWMYRNPKMPLLFEQAS